MDLIINNDYTKIENGSSAEINVIDELLALKQPGYFFSPAFKSGRWDGKVRFLDKRGLVFPTGLLDKVLDALTSVGYGKPNLIDERSFINVKVPKKITLEEPDAEGGVITLRDYQHEAVSKVFEMKRGIVNVATNGGKCITKDTLLLTSEGYKTLERVFEENGTPCETVEKVIPAKIKLINRYGEVEETSHLTFNGLRPVRRIKTHAGLVSKATYNHPLLVVTDAGEFIWKPASEIEIGDKLVTRKGDEVFGSDALITDIEEAYCLGMLVADGYIGQKYKIGFSNDKKELLDAMERYLNRFATSEITRQGNPRVQRKVYTKQKGESVVLYDTDGVRNFHERLGTKLGVARDKVVPDAIMNGSKVVQLAFISAYLECECDIRTKSAQLSVTSASYTLLVQVNLLLKNLGIRSSHRERKTPNKICPDNYYGHVVVYGAELIKLLDMLEFRTEQRINQKRDTKEAYANKSNHRFPKEHTPGGITLVNDFMETFEEITPEIRKARRKVSSSQRRPVHKHKIRRLLNAVEGGSQEMRKRLEELTSDFYVFDEVIEIKELDSEPTFDVCMPKTHSFIANGIVNHNTEVASGIIKLLLPKLKRGERILFVTHNIEIFTQSAKRIARRLGLDEDEIGMVGGGEWVEKPITMVMVPTLSRHTKKPVSELPDSAYKKEFKAIRFLLEFIGKHIKKSEPDNRDIMINAIQVLEDVSGKKREQLAIDILTEIVSTSKTSTACFKQFEKLRKDLKAFEAKKLKALNKNYERAMDLLKSAVCFIADEAHHSSSTTWYENLMLCENAIYRIGLTGTVDKKNEIGMFRLFSVTGEVLTKISNDFLIERGISAKPTIYMSTVSQPDIKALDFQPAYDYGIVNNSYRNNLIAEQVRQSYNNGQGCLIIVNRMKHGENIKKLLDELGVPNEFTHGSFDNREGVLKDMKEGRLKVLIATTIMDEGIDISGINALFMAAGGKSFRQILQRIGRGLRVKADGSGLDVYDYLDLTNKYLTKHTQERFDYYRAEKFEVTKL